MRDYKAYSAEELFEMAKEATERGRIADETEVRADEAYLQFVGIGRAYNLVIELTNMSKFIVSLHLLQGLRGEGGRWAKNLNVGPGGRSLEWPELDVQHGVVNLVNGRFGNDEWMEMLRKERSDNGPINSEVPH